MFERVEELRRSWGEEVGKGWASFKVGMLVVFPDGRFWRIFPAGLTEENFTSMSKGSRMFKASEIQLPNPDPARGAAGPVRVNLDQAAGVFFMKADIGRAQPDENKAAYEARLEEGAALLKKQAAEVARLRQAKVAERMNKVSMGGE